MLNLMISFDMLKLVTSDVDIVLFLDANTDLNMTGIVILSVIGSFQFGICYLSLLFHLPPWLLLKHVLRNLICMIFELLMSITFVCTVTFSITTELHLLVVFIPDMYFLCVCCFFFFLRVPLQIGTLFTFLFPF